MFAHCTRFSCQDCDFWAIIRPDKDMSGDWCADDAWGNFGPLSREHVLASYFHGEPKKDSGLELIDNYTLYPDDEVPDHVLAAAMKAALCPKN